MSSQHTSHGHAHHRGQHHDHHADAGHHHAPAQDAGATALATDPVCGMTVDPATSKHRMEHGGSVFHFCSAGCRVKFAADPAKYLAPKAAAPASGDDEAVYTQAACLAAALGTRLGWLADRLGEGGAAARPVLLFMHHPPAASGIAGMDVIPLLDTAALWEVLAPHRARVRHLFHGHLHRPFSGSWRGVPFSSLRGTSHQVALDLSGRSTVPGSQEPPAYALVRIGADEVAVHVHDYLDATGTFDL